MVIGYINAYAFECHESLYLANHLSGFARQCELVCILSGTSCSWGVVYVFTPNRLTQIFPSLFPSLKYPCLCQPIWCKYINHTPGTRRSRKDVYGIQLQLKSTPYPSQVRPRSAACAGGAVVHGAGGSKGRAA